MNLVNSVIDYNIVHNTDLCTNTETIIFNKLTFNNYNAI